MGVVPALGNTLYAAAQMAKAGGKVSTKEISKDVAKKLAARFKVRADLFF